jgi:hypothetical protein
MQRENYGAKSPNTNILSDVRHGIKIIWDDSSILALGITSCIFEGSMYLFIFFWSAALKSAHLASATAATNPQGLAHPVAIQPWANDLPFGLIFSSFMCAMMAGSAVFSFFYPTKQNSASILMHCVLLTSVCFSCTTMLTDERLVFWGLCFIEACVGIYFPSMSLLKSEVVEDGVRGRVYSILRAPLNIFVVIVHVLDQEGECSVLCHAYPDLIISADAIFATRRTDRSRLL